MLHHTIFCIKIKFLLKFFISSLMVELQLSMTNNFKATEETHLPRIKCMPTKNMYPLSLPVTTHKHRLTSPSLNFLLKAQHLGFLLLCKQRF